MPKHHIEYVHNDMPQDILIEEERKDQMTSEQKLIMWLKQFTRELKASTAEIGQDLQMLNSNKEEVLKLIKNLAKFPEAEKASKSVLDIVTSKIAAIENQTNKI